MQMREVQMEVYKKNIEETDVIQFKKAVLYKFNPIKVPIPFWDSTGGPFETVPMGYWLVLYDQHGIAGQAPCSEITRKLFLPILFSGEARTYEEWYQLLYWKYRNNGFCGETAVELGRIDLAFHDIMSKRKGLPLHKFFGATRDWVNVYASGCSTHLTETQMVNEVEQFIEEGYTTFKMKIATDFGTNLDRDVERVKIVRSLIGKDCRLALDANQLWKAQEAYEFIKRVEEYNIAWYEEPVNSYDFEELEKLTQMSPVPISMGESPRCGKIMYAYIKAGVKHLQPIPTNQSGAREWFYTQELAKRYGTEFTAGGMSHITASFIATGAEEDMVEYLAPINRGMYDLMELRPEEKNGKFYLPSEPGISVSPDFKLMEKSGLIDCVEYWSE